MLAMLLAGLGSAVVFIVKLWFQANLDRARIRLLEHNSKNIEIMLKKISTRINRISKSSLIGNMKLNSLKDNYERLDSDVQELKKMLSHVEKRKEPRGE